MTINAVKYHNYIVRAIGGEKIKYVNEIIHGIESNNGEIKKIETSYKENNNKSVLVHFSVNDLSSIAKIKENLESRFGEADIQFMDEITHLHLGGKLETTLKHSIDNMSDLAKVYTPGVAQVCMEIAHNPERAYDLTVKKNTVAVVSDGTAVLGLGDIGPEAAMPVMDGKAVLFKQFAGVDAFPICLDTKDPEEIIAIVKALAPTFGGINLEDISAPRCFEIEERLKQELDIPVFHDDQHGTAVTVLAGFLNALKVCKKNIADVKVVLVGIGAAGIAVSKMLLSAGVKNLIGIDRQGAIFRGAPYSNESWNEYARITNPYNEQGQLADVIEGADVFIGLSGPGVLKVDYLKKMARDPIVFAMANPAPEITPEEAAPYVRVMATGRSDYPNQLDNVLCFPGIFRGALDCGARQITEEMKLEVAKAIASVVSDDELSENYIIPDIFNKDVVKRVSEVVAQTARRTGMAKIRSNKLETLTV